MNKCKQCNVLCEITFKGLRNFCSHKCKKEYRVAYMKGLMARKRSVSKIDGYLDINVSKKPENNIVKTSTYEGQKDSLGLSMDNFSGFGGKKWYDMAKRYCCNFEVREREGNCLTLLQPYSLFTKPCNQCDLGMALNLRYQ